MNVMHYLNYEGRCEEAFNFYAGAIGAKPGALMRVKESPDSGNMPPMPAGSENKVLHGEIMIGDTMIMATDGMCSGKAEFKGVSLVLNAKDPAEAKKNFDALADGGQVNMPLSQTFFSSAFGMLNDRFGVQWMIIVPMPRP